MVMLLVTTLAATGVTQEGAAVNPHAAALAEFSGHLQEYLTLRRDLAQKLAPLGPTASAIELQQRQQQLAAALRAARAGAKPGDLIPAPVQDFIRREVTDDFRRRDPQARQAALAEVPTGPLPGINRNYPDRAALPTVPPLLLARLPQLPDKLHYRFFGRHLVVLDGDVEIVIDYVRNALPR